MFESSSRVALVRRSDYALLIALDCKAGHESGEKNMGKIANMKILDDHLFPADAVRIGAVISLKDLGTGSVAKLLLTKSVDRHKRTYEKCMAVSVGSRLGVALLGMRLGDDIKWTLPSGHIRYLRIADLM